LQARTAVIGHMWSLTDIVKRHKLLLVSMILSAGLVLYIPTLFSGAPTGIDGTSRGKSASTAHLNTAAPPSTDLKEVALVDIQTRSTAARQYVHRATQIALQAKALAPLTTSFRLLQEEGIQFIVSVAEEVAAKVKDDRATIAGAAPAPATDKSANAVGAGGFDPFSAEEREKQPSLVVGPVGEDHVLMLNKFPTMQDHVLLVTSEWEPQSSPLTPGDLSSLHLLASCLPAVGFYNSAAPAGASQAHKHMQLIPFDVLETYRPKAAEVLPTDAAMMQRAAALSVSGDRIAGGRAFTLPQFRFRHALALLPDHLEPGTGQAGDYLQELYRHLLHEAGVGEEGGEGEDGQAHNLLLTAGWMMVVPRSKRKGLESIDVNAMGFIGCLLIRTHEALEAAEKSPLKVLESVTWPESRGTQ